MVRARRISRWMILLALGGLALALLGSGDSLGFAGASQISRGMDCRRVVALTFDDGPNPPYTQQVLEVLIRNRARATFFVEGQAAAAHPETVKLLVESGMAIGSHSYGHSRDLPKMSAADFRRDLTQTEVVLEDILGQKPQLYRAPFGKVSADDA